MSNRAFRAHVAAERAFTSPGFLKPVSVLAARADLSTAKPFPGADARLLRPAEVPYVLEESLKRTFCSYLAMRGAPTRAIQELAGHQDLSTTQRYMHLSPAAIDAAIRLLETGAEVAAAVERKRRERRARSPVCIQEKWWRRRESNAIWRGFASL